MTSPGWHREGISRPGRRVPGALDMSTWTIEALNGTLRPHLGRPNLGRRKCLDWTHDVNPGALVASATSAAACLQ